MKKAYPIVLTPDDTGGYIVYVPDMQINTEGKDLSDAMFMARDAISLTGISMEDIGKSIPEPSHSYPNHQPEEIVTFVDVDFDTYRKAHDNRAIRKNCTIPSWLNERAEKAGINFSQALQEGLKSRLGI